MRMRVRKTVTFDAAHRLPYYKGLCANLHGHRWTLHVSIEGEVEPLSGMVMDFKDLDGEINRVISPLDHVYLNDRLPNPTAENIIQLIGYELQRFLNWSMLELEESPGSCVILSRNEFENHHS
jgi:6-pyruvoyltetrahydropterin/6-carboxytetrahydropterin synthase